MQKATYLYDKPPGEGIIKMLDIQAMVEKVIDKEKHNEKAEEADVEEAKKDRPPKTGFK